MLTRAVDRDRFAPQGLPHEGRHDHAILPRLPRANGVTMTKNYCLDQLKSKRASNLTLVHSNYTDREASLQQKVEDRDSMSWVEKIIDELPEQQKLIIQMRDIEQYEFEEIAKIMDMNETAIRVALSRARKTIREFMTNTHNYGIG